jgi:prepilin-type N-terminal cleavage/methylation domain-containing protein
MRRDKRGFTLIEILVATAVAVLVMGAIFNVFYYLLTVPPQQTDQLKVENQLRLSLDWIQRDGVQAHSFTDTSEENPLEYGYFSSYTDPSDNTHEQKVQYSYDEENDSLVRSVITESSGTPTTATIIAFHITDYDHVIFTPPVEEGDNKVTVGMTVTVNSDTRNDVSETDTRYIEMRAEPQ